MRYLRNRSSRWWTIISTILASLTLAFAGVQAGASQNPAPTPPAATPEAPTGSSETPESEVPSPEAPDAEAPAPETPSHETPAEPENPAAPTTPDAAAPDAPVTGTPEETTPVVTAPETPDAGAVAPEVVVPEVVAPATPTPDVPTPAPVTPAPVTPEPTTPAPTTPGTVQPNASNTGVPAGTKLTRHDGDLVIREAGAVIDGLDIHGFVRVEAPNVTIQNSIIRGTDRKDMAILIYAGTDASNGLVVRDTELAPSFPSHAVNGVYGYGFTLERVDIHSVIDSVHIFGDNVTVESSWLHDNLHYDNDPGWNGGPSHDDSVQIQKGSDIRLVGNSISGAYNAALQITQDQGTTSNVTFSKNWVADGGCTLNIAEKGKGAIAGLVVTDNIFGDSRFGCSVLVPPTTVATATGNVKADGSTLRVDRRAQ